MNKKKNLPNKKTIYSSQKPTFGEQLIFGLTIFILLAIVLAPIIILFQPPFWNNFRIAPKFYLVSIIFFFCPFCIILAKPVWRNPFFVAPFSISFVIASVTSNYFDFLINYWLYLGSILTLFAIWRTKPPYRALELKLYLTDYFTDYFEVQYFWRTVVLLSSPFFIPVIFILFNFIC